MTTRRRLLGAAAATVAAPRIARGAAPRAVIVGGGFGGATAARYLRRLDPSLDVTLVDRSADYLTCPFSNLVLVGERRLDDLRQDRSGLASTGITLVTGEVAGVDATARKVSLADGAALAYDRLLLAPGIDIVWNGLQGYDEAAASLMPHAWKAGPQTELLKRQLQAMPDGGTVIITAPAAPYRCPPGPYERASLIAWWLGRAKPRSKVLILDAKDSFSKQALFLQAFADLYPGRVEWIGAAAGGHVTRVDPAAMSVETDMGSETGAVINVIPPQQAGRIAALAGTTDAKGWCPVDPTTLESTLVPGIHVIGDACIAGPMPKSATAANSQAKAAAAAIVALLRGDPPPEPIYANTCYSLLDPTDAISVTGVYGVGPKGIAELAGGVSAPDADRTKEAAYARDWYAGIVQDSFG
ncbi:MAG: NAD(P)/FAD-dependent oxidoreductase [Geminicoccaceae bacterium]